MGKKIESQVSDPSQDLHELKDTPLANSQISSLDKRILSQRIQAATEVLVKRPLGLNWHHGAKTSLYVALRSGNLGHILFDRFVSAHNPRIDLLFLFALTITL
jgi:hypothetical protein